MCLNFNNYFLESAISDMMLVCCLSTKATLHLLPEYNIVVKSKKCHVVEELAGRSQSFSLHY